MSPIRRLIASGYRDGSDCVLALLLAAVLLVGFFYVCVLLLGRAGLAV